MLAVYYLFREMFRGNSGLTGKRKSGKVSLKYAGFIAFFS